MRVGSRSSISTALPVGPTGPKAGAFYRDPNEIVMLFEWDDVGKARQFAGSDDLCETMQRAGVADHPDVYFLEEIEAVSV